MVHAQVTRGRWPRQLCIRLWNDIDPEQPITAWLGPALVAADLALWDADVPDLVENFEEAAK